MQKNFPLFQSHLDLAHAYWGHLLQRGDWAIDATCGRGNDTRILAELLSDGGVIGIDIQKEAIQETKKVLEASLALETFSKIHLFQQSHSDFPKLAEEVPVKLVVYNLGYLPRGDKKLTTETKSTLESVTKALELLVPGGALSIMCYPGHPEGALEEKALIAMLGALPQALWSVCRHTFLNRKDAPNLILVQRCFH
jgi:SAM-dependent methyltransferase